MKKELVDIWIGEEGIDIQEETNRKLVEEVNYWKTMCSIKDKQLQERQQKISILGRLLEKYQRDNLILQDTNTKI